MEIKLTGEKPERVKKLIFSMLDVLEQVGISMNSTHRRLEKMAMACLAVGNVNETLRDAKSAADGCFLTTREIISYENKHFSEHISSGSYDDIRRKDLLLPVQAGIVISSSSMDPQATNNPMRGYALNLLFADLLRYYGTPVWKEKLKEYVFKANLFNEEAAQRQQKERIPVKLTSDIEIGLTYGEHNILQKLIVEEFLPRFGMGAEVLYIGDTADKYLYMRKDVLRRINFFMLGHEELPDVVSYCESRNLLFLIEAVHSAGPMSEARVMKLKKQLENCTAIPVFITAFMNKKGFRRWAADIAWESEVWIADSPDHMIHFNGYKFLEIHK